jgi:hypothetical protein
MSQRIICLCSNKYLMQNILYYLKLENINYIQESKKVLLILCFLIRNRKRSAIGILETHCEKDLTLQFTTTKP